MQTWVLVRVLGGREQQSKFVPWGSMLPLEWITQKFRFIRLEVHRVAPLHQLSRRPKGPAPPRNSQPRVRWRPPQRLSLSVPQQKRSRLVRRLVVLQAHSWTNAKLEASTTASRHPPIVIYWLNSTIPKGSWNGDVSKHNPSNLIYTDDGFLVLLGLGRGFCGQLGITYKFMEPGTRSWKTGPQLFGGCDASYLGTA